METIQVIIDFILWGTGISICLCTGWCIWAYATNLPSHSEQTEEEEKLMLESMKNGKGLRASEMDGE